MTSQAKKQSLVWGGLLIIFGVTTLIETFVDLSTWVWVAILTASGLGVLVIYLTDRSQWGFVITTYVLWAIAGLLALTEVNILPDTAIALYTLSAIALPFIAVFVRDRDQWWALIPAYVLLSISGIVGLTEWHILPDTFIAPYVLSAVALPFIVIFLRDREQWWALIPTYVLLSVGLMTALIELNILVDLLIPAYIMFVIAIPFFTVYVRDRRQWWALIPAGVMTVTGASFLIAEALFQYIGAVALILVGIWILGRQFVGKREREDEPADKPT